MPDHLDTLLIHAGEPIPRIEGAVVTPIFQSAMYLSQPGQAYHEQGYIRLGTTPNHRLLNAKLAAIENAEDCVVAGSGMAAITASVLAFASTGDRIMTQRSLYGGTLSFFFDDLARFGIGVDEFDARDPASWEQALTPRTRVLYCESIANPTMEVGDLAGMAAFARGHGLVSLIDNTFATPVNFRPMEHGFDVSIHSATKYLNGHSDIVAGCAIGSREHVAKVNHRLTHLGGALDPHAAFLLHRGLLTLSLRVHRQNDSALALARALEGHPRVARVNYPGLESHEDHSRARRLFVETGHGGFGGMLSIELKGTVDHAQRFMDALRLPIKAPSLGGVESLITRAAASSHAGLTPEQRAAMGVSDTLIRISVGVEDARDLITDFCEALDQI